MSMNPKPELRSIEDFELSIEAAGGYKVRSAGYIWCTTESKKISNDQELIQSDSHILPSKRKGK